MEERLPEELRAGLESARIRKARQASRLRIALPNRNVRILRLGKSGFVVAREDAPDLPGLVDVFDGARHLFQCLIVASSEDGPEMHFEFKRATPILDRVPRDFEERPRGHIALIEDFSA